MDCWRGGNRTANGGRWNGAGLTSSAAASDSTRSTAIGYLDDGTQITIHRTIYGDANLDGRINADDYALADRGLAKHLAGWVNGDFNYDGSVTAGDYLLLEGSYPTPSAAPASPVVAAPAVSETNLPPVSAVSVAGNAAPAPSPAPKQ
ncbi:MAG TPA: dockerin type I repeat-containing protein [Tepidisphaeraceae bacterium]|jgi:hypothetical protein|nr:dockerin type I repeat-containing protein [Tepidisphaeraceae bacterium]